MKYNTLRKSELKIHDIQLNEVNLSRVADCVAEFYKVARDKVLVIDVRNQELALDVLDDNLDPHYFMAQERGLLDQIAQIPGVQLGSKARVTSDGILGWIGFDANPQEVEDSLIRAEEITNSMMENISRRVVVFPSGFEVENGEIEDTNTPMIVKTLSNNGFVAEEGPILKDDKDYIVGKLIWAIGKGFGTIITTGGVGAEDKDHSVESILALDPDAATPYIAKFKKGHGRHVKDGIRIAVGEVDHVQLIALPGPNDEVSLCLPVLLDGIQKRMKKNAFSQALANVLRHRLQEKCTSFYHTKKWEGTEEKNEDT